MPDDPGVSSAPEQEMREEIERLRLLHRISQEFNSSLDLDELLPKVFDTVLSAVGAQGGSLWIAEGDELRCQLAMGASSQKLVGTTMPVGSGLRRRRGPEGADHDRQPRHPGSPIRTAGGPLQLDDRHHGHGDPDGGQGRDRRGHPGGEQGRRARGSSIEQDREILEGLAGSAAVALRNAQLHAAEKRARDLAFLLEVSREITSTLDLDRVLLTVVNLSARAFTFDRGAVALVDRGTLGDPGGRRAGADRPQGPRAPGPGGTRGLGRIPWRGLPPARPGGPGIRRRSAAFASAFGDALAGEQIRSVLYLPLKDEEGLLGVLLFESREPGIRLADAAGAGGDPGQPDGRSPAQRPAVSPGPHGGHAGRAGGQTPGIHGAAKAAEAGVRRAGGRRPRPADAGALAAPHPGQGCRPCGRIR